MKEFKKMQTKRERYEELKLKYGSKKFFVREYDYNLYVKRGPILLTKRIESDVSIDNLSGRIVDVIHNLQEYVDQYGEEVNLNITNNLDDYSYYDIEILEMETEEQFEKRLEVIREQIEYEDLRAEFDELVLFEQLKKKYESS